MRTLDRYVIRVTLGPFFLALGVFTFALAIDPMMVEAQTLLARGVPAPTLGFLLVTLLPQALGLTIPMAFLAALLMSFGRLSSDREVVALLACGVSPARLLRPVFILATLTGAATMYVMLNLIPEANQRYLEVVYGLVKQKIEQEVHPRVFFEDFPGRVLYVQELNPAGGWTGVLLADTTQPGRPTVDMANSARLILDETARKVDIYLDNGATYTPGAEEGVYLMSAYRELKASLDPNTVFPRVVPVKGIREMTIAELRVAIENDLKVGQSPHNEIIAIHQKFSFPVACFVFALLGMALGLHTRREGKLAGFTLGMAVIFVYYALLEIAESLAKGHQIPAEWARWIPNLVLGPMGIAAVWWRMRSTDSVIRLRLPARWTARAGGASSAEGTPRRGRRVVLVVRVPRIPLPRPRLLDLYVGSRFLRVLALAFLALMGLFYISTFIDLSEKLLKGQATASLVAQYLWYRTPQFVDYVIPIATLVAVLVTIGVLTRTSELTVMRACGVSLYRTAAPLVFLAAVCSALLFLLEERVLAQANRRADSLEATIRGRPPRTLDAANRTWIVGGDGRIYYYAAYDVRHQEFRNLSVFETSDRPFRLVRQTFASQVRYDHGGWSASAGWVQHFPARGQATRENFATRRLSLEEPDYFGTRQLDPEIMNFGQLRAYITKLEAGGFSVTEDAVALHRKIAFPFVTIIMTLVGVPFAVTTGKRGALYGIGLAIVLAVIYQFASTLFLAAGGAGLLPPPLAAWAANGLFLAGALSLMLTVRT